MEVIMTLGEVKAYLEDSGSKFIHVGILTHDLNSTVSTLESYPFVGKFADSHTVQFGRESLEVGAPYVITIANAAVAGHDFVLEVLQPDEEKSDPDNIYSSLLSKYGSGLSHVAYSVPSEKVFDTASAAFIDAGYKVILKGGVKPDESKGIRGNAFIYLDPDDGSNCFLELLLAK